MAGAPPRCLHVAPVLQVADVRRSEAFYTEKLGFRSTGVWGDPPSFCIVKRDAATLMLDRSERDGPLPLNQYWAAYIYVDDVDAVHRAFSAAGAEIARAPEDMFYGCRDFDVRDPDGHLIAFGQDLPPAQGS